MKLFKTVLILKLLLILVVAGAAAGLFFWIKNSENPDNVTMCNATVRDVQGMVNLCSMEIYEDVPIKAHIGKRHIFARQQLRGSISFDLEKLRIDTIGDTIRVVLPPEIIDVYESTEPDAYRVIDTWNESFLGSDKFTVAEENSIKAKAKQQWLRRQYAKGTVRRARKEAVINLRDMLSGIYKLPVIVSDPTPQGAYHP